MGDILTFEVQDDLDYIRLNFKNPAREAIFNINLVTLDSDTIDIPECQYDKELTMNSLQFYRLCKDLYNLSETLTFDVTDNQVRFEVEGEIGSGKIKVKNGRPDDDVKQDPNNDKLSFALRYLNLFNKANSLSDVVKL
jgi:proliferating cell nuclear antigen